MDTFIAAFLLGFLGGAHCISMCGGITAALSMSINNSVQRWKIIFFYNIGRISSYTFIGFLAGLLGSYFSFFASNYTAFPILRILAAALLILMGFYITGWWRILTRLEKTGGFIWKKIQPLGRKFFPVTTIPHALIVGALWGWLPCGLVYSALTYSLAQATPINAALVMACFGLGTFPAVFAGGVAGSFLQQLLKSQLFKIVSGILLILFGVWTGYIALKHYGHHGHHEHHQHTSEHTSDTPSSMMEGMDHSSMMHEHHHHEENTSHAGHDHGQKMEMETEMNSESTPSPMPHHHTD